MYSENSKTIVFRGFRAACIRNHCGASSTNCDSRLSIASSTFGFAVITVASLFKRLCRESFRTVHNRRRDTAPCCWSPFLARCRV